MSAQTQPSVQTQPTEPPPQAVMLQVLQGLWVSRAVYVAAKLGIADLLKDGPKGSADLANATGTDAPSLYRVLRALDSIGVFVDDGEGRFALTPLGATLRTDVPGSLRYFAIEELGENHYPAWEKVLYSVKTGATAFDHVYGMNKWQYMTEHPDEARIFAQAMASLSSTVAAASPLTIFRPARRWWTLAVATAACWLRFSKRTQRRGACWRICRTSPKEHAAASVPKDWPIGAMSRWRFLCTGARWRYLRTQVHHPRLG